MVQHFGNLLWAWCSASFIVSSVLCQKPGEPVPNSYLVVFKDPITNSTMEEHQSMISSLLSDYQTSKSFSEDGSQAKSPDYGIVRQNKRSYVANLPDDVARQLQNQSDVAAVEQDIYRSVYASQSNAPWPLVLISRGADTGTAANGAPAAAKPVTGTAPGLYNFPDSAGTGVVAYVIDTGIKVDHPDYNGRATWGANMVKGEADQDLAGHGTHVAGTIGSTTYGVAKNVSLVAVKAFNAQGSASTSAIVAAINWVVKDVQTKGLAGKQKAVINMSNGGPISAALDAAVNTASNAGIVVVVAAGNENQDACRVSPAHVPNALTVGAVDNQLKRATFSNYGSCVDIFGPGVDIISTSYKGGTQKMSGTSMATPHGAGVVALALSQNNFKTALEAIDYVKQNGLSNVVTALDKASPNLMMAVSAAGGAGAAPAGNNTPTPAQGPPAAGKADDEPKAVIPANGPAPTQGTANPAQGDANPAPAQGGNNGGNNGGNGGNGGNNGGNGGNNGGNGGNNGGAKKKAARRKNAAAGKGNANNGNNGNNGNAVNNNNLPPALLELIAKAAQKNQQ